MNKFLFVHEKDEGETFSLTAGETTMLTPHLIAHDDGNGKLKFRVKGFGKEVDIEYMHIPELWAILGEWLAQNDSIPERYVNFPLSEDQ
jgi:hypothetical protein